MSPHMAQGWWLTIPEASEDCSNLMGTEGLSTRVELELSPRALWLRPPKSQVVWLEARAEPFPISCLEASVSSSVQLKMATVEVCRPLIPALGRLRIKTVSD